MKLLLEPEGVLSLLLALILVLLLLFPLVVDWAVEETGDREQVESSAVAARPQAASASWDKVIMAAQGRHHRLKVPAVAAALVRPDKPEQSINVAMAELVCSLPYQVQTLIMPEEVQGVQTAQLLLELAV